VCLRKGISQHVSNVGALYVAPRLLANVFRAAFGVGVVTSLLTHLLAGSRAHPPLSCASSPLALIILCAIFIRGITEDRAVNYARGVKRRLRSRRRLLALNWVAGVAFVSLVAKGRIDARSATIRNSTLEQMWLPPTHLATPAKCTFRSVLISPGNAVGRINSPA